MEDRTQLLLDGAKGLRALADALEITAEMLQQHGLEALIAQKENQPDLIAQQPEAEKTPPKEEIKLSLTDVRKILAEKSRAGYTEQVRLLLEKYGADKLSAIDPSHYQNLIDDALCLGATLDDIKDVIDEKTQEGFGNKIPGVFEHHFATSLDDLKPENYAGFLRDMRRLGHE